MICFKCWAHHFVSAAITAADNCQMRRDGDKQLLPVLTTVTRTLSQSVDSPPLLYNHSVLILRPSAANSSVDAGSPTLKFRKICFNITNEEWSQITSIWTKKQQQKNQENKPTTTLLRRQLGGRDFNFTHLTRPSCQVSVESVSFRIPWQISSPSVAASNCCKPSCLGKKKKNTGGDQEETEPGRQQPRTMKPIRPRWEQTPPTFEPLNCKELKRKILWLVAKMAGNSKQWVLKY